MLPGHLLLLQVGLVELCERLLEVKVRLRHVRRPHRRLPSNHRMCAQDSQQAALAVSQVTVAAVQPCSQDVGATSRLLLHSCLACISTHRRELADRAPVWGPTPAAAAATAAASPAAAARGAAAAGLALWAATPATGTPPAAPSWPDKTSAAFARFNAGRQLDLVSLLPALETTHDFQFLLITAARRCPY
jgi:hypothetical protein